MLPRGPPMSPASGPRLPSGMLPVGPWAGGCRGILPSDIAQGLADRAAVLLRATPVPREHSSKCMRASRMSFDAGSASSNRAASARASWAAVPTPGASMATATSRSAWRICRKAKTSCRASIWRELNHEMRWVVRVPETQHGHLDRPLPPLSLRDGDGLWVVRR